MIVGIIGAGTMGAEIAQVFASSGKYEVKLCDMTNALAQSGNDKISARLSRAVQRGRITQEQAASALEKITPGTISLAADCSLIIEAVQEKIATKKAVFESLMDLCSKDTIFTSNTSSLSLTDLSKGLDRPVIGMHFFNPVSVMELVEVIPPHNTPQQTLNRILSIIESIGKTPVIMKDAAGFVVNRLLIPMINEAAAIYSEGVADAKGIDTAMRLGANHPIGPLALADLIGLDVCLAVLEVLQLETGDSKYRPHPLLKAMVRDGKLGRKSGCGFYDYPHKKA
ncbi:MAG: 3-hydroxyacyl-CoA dehydrogenase family protein [Christensenellales bacterium]|jgi:3-hydroxybutyryl-CoA dehydrogenase